MSNRKFSCRTLLSIPLLIFSLSVFAQDASVQNGEKIFKANCLSCHKVDKKVIGPALVGSEQRWVQAGDFGGLTGKQWLYRWIRNSQEVVREGYPYAVNMFNDYNKSVMTAFPLLTDDDIRDVLAYVEKAALESPQVVAPGPGGAVPGSEDTSTTQLFLYLLIGLLVGVVLILGKITSALSRMALQKQGLPIPEAVPFYRDKKIIVTLSLILLIYIGYATVNSAIDLGRQQGYAPEQPIKYSHELHAGLNQINCQYCHSSAEDSKHSNIPSANVCMNCHKGIRGDDPVNGKYGRAEIAKIYASLGYDPNTLSYIPNYERMPVDKARELYTQWLKEDENRRYTKNDIEEVLSFIQKPIEWVRVHNLPDHVYFNHSQHVTVAGLECQTCHGPVEEMEVLYQHAPLSMGWCITCHRESEVNFATNDYYKDYHKLHEDLKSGKISRVTVETIGGTECQKCHY